MGQWIPTIILLLCLCAVPRAQAGATLLLGEPYSYDGLFAGTGHAAVYLSGVCANSPITLRLCSAGETGIVISRYRGIAGYDWIAIPLIPYLYAVEKQEDIPLFADKKIIAFLRDRYRRNHLLSLVPDLPDGDIPGGVWYELIGASYLRTIYAFEIATSPEQDIGLILWLNNRSNRQRWNLVTANCADFAREVISFYYPHSVHRGIIGDLGVTTPKQLARTLTRYSKQHAELRTSRYVIPQVPGTISRSKRMRGVLEVVLTSKKYMLPILLFHPYAAAGAVALYVGHWHFNLGKDSPVLDTTFHLGDALRPVDRQAVRDQVEELARVAPSAGDDKGKPNWTSSRAEAEAQPALDAFGSPALKVMTDRGVMFVGIARSNILSVPTGTELAAGLVKARLNEELKSAAAHKTSRADVESDVVLLRKLLASQLNGFSNIDSLTDNSAPVLTGSCHNCQGTESSGP